jgi:hypothetical protein
MQTQAWQLPSLELADRRLIEARQRFQRPLRQAGLASPFVGFSADSDKLVGDLGLD